MSEILAMNGHGVYVWTSYAITLAVFVLNLWLAHRGHRRNLYIARGAEVTTGPARRPKVRQL